MSSPSQFKIFANLAIVYVVWGSTFLAVRYAIDVLPPLLASAIRFLLGGTILFTFTLLRGYGIPNFKQWRSAAWVGLLLSGIGNSAVAYALKFMPTGLVALLVATLPVWMVVLDYLFFSKQKPSILTSFGLVVGLFGMYILLNPTASLNRQEVVFWPACLVFLGSIAWAWGSIQSPYLSMPSQIQSTAIQMLAGGAFALTASLLVEPNGTASIAKMTSQTYCAMAYLIFVGSFVGYSAYVWLINHATPSLTATYAYVNPVVAMLLGWLLLNETLSSRTLMASAIILGGVVLITLGRRKKAVKI
ncbi:MAG: EamA family transporter [Runella slithyformis]|nr:MAG: EamA family transporter [Runella slithyformis]TAF96736.1 MAG: EamA family transporter [Runella sp.]TAG19629.1 MAG: EamA family transporter [Cytophagales bacterium]TAG40210.1 MAG: EamA family transporter [Cytophagia bacterium]TAF01281.1 MAG: EamA family transporter [Runella slithyformis]